MSFVRISCQELLITHLHLDSKSSWKIRTMVKARQEGTFWLCSGVLLVSAYILGHNCSTLTILRRGIPRAMSWNMSETLLAWWAQQHRCADPATECTPGRQSQI